MGILQNLKLWTNNVTFIDEYGVEVTREVPRSMPPAPWKVIALMDRTAWMYFLIGLGAWTADGYDFNAVNLVATDLAVQFDRDLTDITLSVTLTLLFRSLGAVFFGTLADTYGRKWPLAADLLVLAVLQVGTAYASSFEAFIAVRAIFGIAMGGVWGLAAAISLENMHVDARGLFSGILQQGYALGYLIAAVINLTAVRYSSEGWKAIFHVGAGFTGLMAIIVALMPESKIYQTEDRERKTLKEHARMVAKDMKLAARQYWGRFLYCVILSMGFNWMSHGSQDVYPSYLKVQKGFSSSKASQATIVGQVGAVTGGAICGYYSQFVGRRLTVVAACIFGACMIPLWVTPSDWSSIIAGTFFIQSAVNGAWGVMPILLNEYAPPQFRGVFPGTVYQLGNMLSAPAAQIQTVAASNWIRPTQNGPKPNYSQVMAIVMSIVFTAVAIITSCGSERRGSHFELAQRAGAEDRVLVNGSIEMKQNQTQHQAVGEFENAEAGRHGDKDSTVHTETV